MTSEPVKTTIMQKEDRIGEELEYTQTEDVEEKGYIYDDPVFSREEQRRITRRIDFRVITALGAIYCISLVDRGNLPNAAIAGMTDDLDLSVGYRYVFLSCPHSSPNAFTEHW